MSSSLTLFFIVGIVIATPNAFSQMTYPSVFPDMPSVNPAVATFRKQGLAKLSVRQDSLEKNQIIDFIDSHRVDQVEISKIKLNEGNLFATTKGGHFAAELIYDKTVGEQRSDRSINSSFTLGYNIKTSADYLRIALANTNGMGIDIHGANVKSNYSDNITQNGTGNVSAMNSERSLSVVGVKPGLVLDIGAISFGATLEYNKFQTTTSGDQVLIAAARDTSTIIGLGFGFGNADGVLEVGVEADPFTHQNKASDIDPEPSMPMKISLLAERKFFNKIILGYKGMLYSGSFIDFDKFAQNELVYRTQTTISRLENILNISLVASKGISVGVSYNYSTSNGRERSTTIQSGAAYETSTTETGYGVRVGYIF